MTFPFMSKKSTTPLVNTKLQVSITDLVAEHCLVHTFENTGKEAIEAIFSFPIPLDAAFLGMRATLGGETLEAEIQPQHQADRTYGDAIAQGHSTVMLRAPEPGLLCISLGNLLPGETCQIELRFATALRVADQQARFSVPLVHRPRYGHWRLEDLEIPTHNFAIEHPMSATILVQGLLAAAPVTCLTHAARFAQRDGALELSINQAMLDRDLVLTFDLQQQPEPVGHLISDGDMDLGLVSFVLPPRRGHAAPMDLCLVLDCSGSMSGDAIIQSQQATAAIVDALNDDDRIQVLRFGSSTVPMFRRPLLATTRVKAALRELLPSINADLGGTNMGDALERALADLGTKGRQTKDIERSRAIILVTDGAVQPHDIAGAKNAACHAKVRVFVVAVGSSAGAETLEPLAERTDAVMERAVPAEPIDAGVMRQFRRAREAGPVAINVRWPDDRATPVPLGVAYPGDAVSVAAQLSATRTGDVHIEVPSLGFAAQVSLAEYSEINAMRALVGMQRYRHAPEAEREGLALHYGLLTRETTAVLVKLHAEHDKANSLPQIVQIPQMVPDGMMIASHSAKLMSQSVASMSCTVMESFYDLDVPSFESRLDDEVPIDDGHASAPNMPPMPSAEVHALFVALYKALLEALSAGTEDRLDIEAMIVTLPAKLRDQTRSLLASLEYLTAPWNENDAVVLLIALNDVLNHPPFTDDQEAAIAVILNRDSDVSTYSDNGREARLIEEINLLFSP